MSETIWMIWLTSPIPFDRKWSNHIPTGIERQSGGSFNPFSYFIITPDRYMDKRVRKVLHKLSVEDKDIFAVRIPSNLRMGLDADVDDFVSGIRYSMPDAGGGRHALI